MKKIIATTLFFVFGFVFSAWSISPANYAYYPTPAPATSFANIAAIYAQLVETTASIKTLINTAQETLNTIKAQGKSLLFGADADKEEVDGAPGQGKYTFCGKPMEDVQVNKIAKKFRYIFTTVKNQRRVNTESRIAARKKFIRDNLIAMKVAVEQIEKDINVYDQKIEDTRQCVVNGSGPNCKYPSQDGGNNEILYAYGQSLKTLDEIVRLWESVVAIKARLASLQALESLKFHNETEADRKSNASSTTSFNFIPIRGKGIYKQTTTKAFASAIDKAKDTLCGAIEGVSNFAQAEDTSEKNPITEARDKILAVNEMNDVTQYVEGAMKVHNLLNVMPQYREKALELEKEENRYKKILQALIEADKCGIKYMSEFFHDPIVAWSGVDLGENANNHELRKGVSGWAYNAYSVAKAAQTSSASTDDITAFSFSDAEKDEYSDDPAASKAGKKAETLDADIGATKEEEVAKEARASALLAWEIGAEASYMVFHEPEKWGKFNDNRPVWEDSKRLYESYIEQKYDNIKYYLKRYSKFDTLKLVYAVVSGGSYSLYEAANQVQIMEKLKSVGEQLLAELDAQVKAKEDMDNAKLKRIALLEDEKEKKLKEVDEISAKLNDNSKKIEEIRNLGESKSFSTMKKNMATPVTFPKKGETVEDVTVAFVSQKESVQIVKEENTKNINEDEIKKLESENNKLKEDRKKIEKDIASIDRQIAQTINRSHDYKITYTNTLESGLKSVDELKTQLELEGISDINNKINQLVKNFMEKEAIEVIGCVSAAERVAEALDNRIDELVDGAKRQILGMGDSLYTAEGHNGAVAIHNKMLSDIKSLRISVNTERKDDSRQVEETDSEGNKTTKTVTDKKMYVTSSLSNSEGALVYGDLKDAGNMELKGLFVGAAPTKRDFNSPFNSSVFGAPHVREVVHFDVDNFINTKPLIDGKIDKADITSKDFLKFGGNLPAVWKHMLEDKTFIERRYDLSKALSLGCENEILARGGIFPCVVEGTSYVLDRNSQSEEYLLSEADANELPKCKQLALKDGKIVHTTFNSEIKTKTGNSNYDADCTYSELGMFLDADTNNNLSYKSFAFNDVYRTLAEDGDDDNFDDKVKNKFAVANYAILNENIVGSFLKYSEYESKTKENLDSLRSDYEELKKELYEQFAALGFTPSEEFNLAKEEDYNLSIQKLKEIKNEHVQEASNRISAIDTKDNEMTAEGGEKMQRLLSYLQKDEEAIMQISLSDRDNLNFDEEFQKKKTDNAVVDKYEKSLKEKQKEQNEDLIPYCANF